MLIFAIAVAGAAGAVSRFLLDEFVQHRTRTARPLGTLVINVTGSFVLGLLTGLALYHALAPNTKTVLGTGFCGAYTTFSTFTYQSVRLEEEGEQRVARLNVIASVVLPTLAAALGIAFASL